MQRILLVLLAMLAAVLAPGSLEAQSNRWGADYFPNLPVVTQDGKTVRFYDDLIKGKMVVVSFIYTSCTDICPLTTARMAQLEDKLGDRVGRDIFMLSMTVDPEHDTPAKMKEFADAFHAGPGWTFVTGKPEDIRAINSRLGDRSRKLSEHRNEVVLGNDATGEWQRNSVFGDLDRLVFDVNAMDPKWRDQVRVAARNEAADTGLKLGTQTGQALFKKLCAPCHTIGVGDRVGPDLRDVTSRRERAWLLSFIKNPPKMLADKDPLATALAAKFVGVRMPNLGITDNDAADLVTYLETETARLAAAAQDMPPGMAEAGHDHSQHDHHHH